MSRLRVFCPTQACTIPIMGIQTRPWHSGHNEVPVVPRRLEYSLPKLSRMRRTCKHIARCPEAGRAAAFQESTNAVEIWMETSGTHSDVTVLLLRYSRGQGKTTCLEGADSLDLPPILCEYAAAQDIIGWDNFVMGMVSHKLVAIQSAHFHTAGKSYRATRWIAGLITQVLQVVHTQWIYQCILVHDRTTGVKTAHALLI